MSSIVHEGHEISDHILHARLLSISVPIIVSVVARPSLLQLPATMGLLLVSAPGMSIPVSTTISTTRGTIIVSSPVTPTILVGVVWG